MRDLDDLDELRQELDAFAQAKKTKTLSAREERVIAGFEEVQRFVAEHGRLPQEVGATDIFERLYAVRLQRLRGLEDERDLLASLDEHGLLAADASGAWAPVQNLDDDTLLAELGGQSSATDISALKHVRSAAEKREVGEVADREVCQDFDHFKPLFDTTQQEWASGVRLSVPFEKDTSIEVGHWFVLAGQLAYVADEGEEFDSPQGKKDARLRVIFSNGTESNLLRLSLVRSLYKDEKSRRLVKPDLGPLFSDAPDEGDVESGTIYVLRSHSNHPFVVQNRALVHKLGVTGGKVETRISNAENEATYLLAGVEVVATYKLVGVNRHKIEALLHKVLAPAQLELVIEDRFGKPVSPKEWFLVPLGVIDEIVQHFLDGSITGYVYEPSSAQLISGGPAV